MLVVGGLAGAAWLLTGAAAHAADRAGEPTGLLLGSVVGGDVIAPVTGLLEVAAQPPEGLPDQHRHHVVTDILEIPQRVLSRPMETLEQVADGSTGTSVDVVSDSVATVLGEVAGPLRLTGEPDTDQQGLTAVTDPSPWEPGTTDLTDQDVEPVAERPHKPVTSPVRVESPQVTPVPAPVSPARIAPASRAPIAVATTGVPARHTEATPVTKAHRHPVAHRAAGEHAVTEHHPGGDGPAPLQLHLGDVSGAPATGPGASMDGGSAAVLPTAIASSTMACQRLPIASDVEARRSDAEAPTASPD